MQPDPAQKWIVVTGASAGIGKALIEGLASEGRNVIAAARDPARVSVPNGPGRVEVVGVRCRGSQFACATGW
jgi:NAD(P)-dependent dehydrogenase (short-subunit alcohol dehydrogenase family)